MLIDMIDYHEPTLVIVGSRGLAKIKGMLLGSVSNYLIQKSSVPVMVRFKPSFCCFSSAWRREKLTHDDDDAQVTRRPLRVSHTVHRKLSSLNREARVTLSGASIEKESRGGAVDDGESRLLMRFEVEAYGIGKQAADCFFVPSPCLGAVQIPTSLMTYISR